MPPGALEAAAAFHAEYMAQVKQAVAGECQALVIVLPAAPYDHDDWRRAAARDLARSLAPIRVNIVAGDGEEAVAATLSYLAGASGVTGQYLKTDGKPRANGA